MKYAVVVFGIMILAALAHYGYNLRGLCGILLAN